MFVILSEAKESQIIGFWQRINGAARDVSFSLNMTYGCSASVAPQAGSLCYSSRAAFTI